MERGEGGGDCWVEALEMTDGDDAALYLERARMLVGLGESCGERFLDEDVEAGKGEAALRPQRDGW